MFSRLKSLKTLFSEQARTQELSQGGQKKLFLPPPGLKNAVIPY